jgi:hypothetical protein
VHSLELLVALDSGKKVRPSGRDVRWIELAPDFVSSWALALSVLKFRLGELISDMGHRQIGCDVGKWIQLASESGK